MEIHAPAGELAISGKSPKRVLSSTFSEWGSTATASTCIGQRRSISVTVRPGRPCLPGGSQPFSHQFLTGGRPAIRCQKATVQQAFQASSFPRDDHDVRRVHPSFPAHRKGWYLPAASASSSLHAAYRRCHRPIVTQVNPVTENSSIPVSNVQPKITCRRRRFWKRLLIRRFGRV